MTLATPSGVGLPSHVLSPFMMAAASQMSYRSARSDMSGTLGKRPPLPAKSTPMPQLVPTYTQPARSMTGGSALSTRSTSRLRHPELRVDVDKAMRPRELSRSTSAPRPKISAPLKPSQVQAARVSPQPQPPTRTSPQPPALTPTNVAITPKKSVFGRMFSKSSPSPKKRSAVDNAARERAFDRVFN